MLRALKRFLAGLAVVVAFILGWGLIEPYFLDVEAYTVEVPNLPEAWEGARIGLVSDWQVGMWMDNTWTIERAVDELISEQPDVVLISGDFIYGVHGEPDGTVEKAVELARPLPEAGIPTYAVLGNHDYAMAKETVEPDVALAERLAEALEAAGVQVLQNEIVPLPPPNAASGDTAAAAEPLHLVGLGAHWPRLDEPVATLARLPEGAARFVMMHNPDTFEPIPAEAAPVAVAGHTHGGQIIIPFTPDWSYLNYAKSDEVHADAWVDGSYGAAGNYLYINRGIGFSAVPIRINAAPEITFFTLTRGSGGYE